MAEIETREITDKKTWETFVLQRNPKSFLQSWNWGETNKRVGHKILRLGFYKGPDLVGVMLAIKEEAKRGPHLVIPAGPLIDWNDRVVVEGFLKTAKDLASKERAWFVRVRPELLDTDDNKKLFKILGFIPSPMHLHAENTWVLKINRSDVELLRGMRKSTRYLVKKSLTTGLSLEVTIDPNQAEILNKLQKETVERLKFVGFSNELFRAQLETFGRDSQSLLFVCYKNKTPLVASIVIFYGSYAYYHHSGSSSKFREIPSSYFTQWKIITEARDRGCKYYDMWGAVPPGKTKHRFAGPSLFKEGFGCERVDWLHAQDLPISSFYWSTYIFETGRRLIRGL